MGIHPWIAAPFPLGRRAYPLGRTVCSLRAPRSAVLRPCNLHGTLRAIFRRQRAVAAMIRTIRILLLLTLHTSAGGAERPRAVAELAEGLARAHQASRGDRKEEAPS